MPKAKKGGKASKSGKATKGGKKGSKNDKSKRKVKFVDPTSSIGKADREVMEALAKEIELDAQADEDAASRESKKIKAAKIRKQIAEQENIEVKPGMTLRQVFNIVDRVKGKSGNMGDNAGHNASEIARQPNGSIAMSEDEESDEQEEEEEDDEEDGGTEEDYSDTANERAREYRKGGYHPVSIGEIYNNRYRIVKKLGWGYFSTVWLVWDYSEERYQAMKIQKSAKHYREAAADEIKLLSEIMQSDPNKTRCCARLNDNFEHRGPNGVHVCMVFDVYGENLLSLIERYEYNGIPLPIVKCISRQILIALEHISSIDIIHTDLKPENVLLSTPKHSIISLMRHYHPPPLNQRPKLMDRDPKTMTKSQRRRYYKKLSKLKENERNGSTGQGSNDSDDDDDSSRNDDADDVKNTSDDSKTDPEWEVERFHHVILADFGNSCWTYRKFCDEVQTRQYRSPEVILGENYSTPIDIWSFACMVFELITGVFLFDPQKGDGFSRDEDHLARMTELLGELPESMRLGKGKFRKDFYDSNGELRNIHDLHFWPLEDVLHKKYKYTEKKAKEIADFLLPMLEYSPEARATPTEILQNFESFFEIQEDDYEPLCFVEENSEELVTDEEDEGSEEELESYSSEEVNPRPARRLESDDRAEAYRYWEEHPILNRNALEEKGLTITDISDVLSGQTLENKAAHEAAVSIIHMLSEETDRLSVSDGNEADKEDEGEDFFDEEDDFEDVEESD